MVMEDSAMLGRAQRVAGLEIRQLRPEEAQLHASVAAAGFEAPARPFLQLITPEVLRLPGVRCYLGEASGHPVTTGIGVTLGAFVGIFNFAAPRRSASRVWCRRDRARGERRPRRRGGVVLAAIQRVWIPGLRASRLPGRRILAVLAFPGLRTRRDQPHIAGPPQLYRQPQRRRRAPKSSPGPRGHRCGQIPQVNGCLAGLFHGKAQVGWQRADPGWMVGDQAGCLDVNKATGECSAHHAASARLGVRNRSRPPPPARSARHHSGAVSLAGPPRT
jgi:hypothetical protein